MGWDDRIDANLDLFLLLVVLTGGSWDISGVVQRVLTKPLRLGTKALVLKWNSAFS